VYFTLLTFILFMKGIGWILLLAFFHFFFIVVEAKVSFVYLDKVKWFYEIV